MSLGWKGVGMSEGLQPPYFESLPIGTKWHAYEKPGRPILWIPEMPNDNDPLPPDVAQYCLDIIDADLAAIEKSLHQPAGEP